MKKIGIITITDYVNYGNRLQNYASQEVLKSLGFEVETIVNVPKVEIEGGVDFTINRIKNALKLSPIVLIDKAIMKVKDKLSHGKYTACQKAKDKAFRTFTKQYISETDFVVSEHNIPKDLGERYDYFAVGSDQIWNPNIRKGSAFDFIQFASQNKRIALAPSFGVSSIPEKYTEIYTKWISEMACLSVREQAGADIIKKLSGREAEVLVDPTLMLTKEQWLSIAHPANIKPKTKYLLTYFIGVVSAKRKKWLKDFAVKHQLEIVQMASLDDVPRYDANPGEFIDYINSAEIVCTDSFHAVIFSTLLEKPFVVFDREGRSAPMSSRIDTLLSKLKFEDRKFSSISTSEKIFQIDFKHIPDILAVEQQKVLSYLNVALK